MEKQEHIITYVNEKIFYLNSLGISVSQEQINELLNNHIDMSKDESEIINTIDALVERVIENFNKKQEEKQKFIENRRKYDIIHLIVQKEIKYAFQFLYFHAFVSAGDLTGILFP